MASVNKVILVGNLGRDPETRFSADGAAICNFSIATTDSYKDKNTGEKIEKTEWHRISTFQRLAEVCGQYLKKGSQVYIEGRLQTRKWTDKDGAEKYSTDIIADRMQMLGKREGMGGSDVGIGGGDYERTSSGSSSSSKPAASKASEARFDDMDDDIPF